MLSYMTLYSGIILSSLKFGHIIRITARHPYIVYIRRSLCVCVCVFVLDNGAGNVP